MPSGDYEVAKTEYSFDKTKCHLMLSRRWFHFVVCWLITMCSEHLTDYATSYSLDAHQRKAQELFEVTLVRSTNSRLIFTPVIFNDKE